MNCYYYYYYYTEFSFGDQQRKILILSYYYNNGWNRIICSSCAEIKQGTGHTLMRIAHILLQYLQKRLICKAWWTPQLYPSLTLHVEEQRRKWVVLRHTGCAWGVALIGLWTNWTIPAYLFHEPSVVHSSAQWGESLGCPRSIHL